VTTLPAQDQTAKTIIALNGHPMVMTGSICSPTWFPSVLWVAWMSKGTIATGQQNDLHSRRSIDQNFGPQIKAGIVRIDERVVQDQRHRHTLLQ
jgi:hypothetical protein